MRFSETHEWALLEKGKAVIGITEHAQKELGEIVYVEFPKVGTRLKQGEEMCVLESTKAATDIYAPLSGRVVAVNEALLKDPSLINRSPQEEGWLIKLEAFLEREYDALLDSVEYESMVSF